MTRHPHRRNRCLAVLSTVLALAAAEARGQTAVITLKSDDGAGQSPRLVVTTSTATANAEIRIENGILRLSSTAPDASPGAGDIYYTGSW